MESLLRLVLGDDGAPTTSTALWPARIPKRLPLKIAKWFNPF